MNKKNLYNLGKSDYQISDFLITKIICNKLGISQKELFLLEEIISCKEIIKDFKEYKDGKPIEYILGKAEFYGLEFFVDSRVLIPRNDTEIMVDSILDTLSKIDKTDYVDVGTGSGCIPISVLNNSKNINNAFVLDLSNDALDVAQKNFKNHNLNNNITFFNSDLFSTLIEKKSKFLKNLIVSANLPYILDGDYDNMDKSVIKYEPKMALYGGEKTGFELYEKLLDQLIFIKKSQKLENIYAFFEIGFDQYEYSKSYLTQKGLKFEYFKDMNNIYRTLKIKI